MRAKFFAGPWNALTLDAENKRFTLTIDNDRSKMCRGSIRTSGPTLQNTLGRGLMELRIKVGESNTAYWHVTAQIIRGVKLPF